MCGWEEYQFPSPCNGNSERPWAIAVAGANYYRSEEEDDSPSRLDTAFSN